MQQFLTFSPTLHAVLGLTISDRMDSVTESHRRLLLCKNCTQMDNTVKWPLPLKNEVPIENFMSFENVKIWQNRVECMMVLW